MKALGVETIISMDELLAMTLSESEQERTAISKEVLDRETKRLLRETMQSPTNSLQMAKA